MTTAKHMNMYWSVLTVLLLLFLAAPMIVALGVMGALARLSNFWPLRMLALLYTNMVRGIPDIIFFLFVPIALDQLFEILRHKVLCPDSVAPIYQGNDFIVCAQAKLPLGTAEPWVHDSYSFILALIAYTLVFGSFAVNVLYGALQAVPKGQLEAARAYGLSERQVIWRVHLPQMWRFALPGLSNLWQLLIKATPLLFLLGIEDIVYWANTLGASRLPSPATAYPHPDWRIYYFAALMVFYLALTYFSNKVFERLSAKVNRGQSNAY